MKLNRTALALALAIGTASMTTVPAFAKDKEQAKPAERSFNLSSGARKAISELQVAVNAKDAAAIATKLAAAQAAAKTNDDKYIIAKLQLQAAAASNDNAAIAAALGAMVQSGSATSEEQVAAHVNLGKIAYNSKDYANAQIHFDQALKLSPNDTDAMIMSAESLNATGKPAEGAAILRKAIAAKSAAGQKADENWYKRALAFATTSKSPVATDAGIDWVKAYPSTKSWHDMLRLYQQNAGMDPSAAIDVNRLMYATKSLTSEADYYRLASVLVLKGFPGEAKAVLESGFATGAISKSGASIGPLYASATAKAAGDRASLDASAKTAMAQPAASKAVVIADAYAGYGDYAKAIPLYQAALTKSGADKDLINLRLGMAQARSGDKAGASTTLAGVGGTQAGVAKLWQAYVATLP